MKTDTSHIARQATPLPGATPFDPHLVCSINETLKQIQDMDDIRTHHKTSEGFPKYTNRLILESSPYLQQHAHNPVNWYPWGTEAFNTAKELNRPVLVSIGYSTCHWCHVMEEESFEDLEVAEFLNRNFISVKVDREERPDIDTIYMAAVQALNGNGGWPLNVIMTPQQKPFWGGTYFPARDGDRGSIIGFLTILKRIVEVYESRTEDVETTSTQLTDAVRNIVSTYGNKEYSFDRIADNAESFYRNLHDPIFGGIKGSPKFPGSFPVPFLLRRFYRTGDQELLKMVEQALAGMSSGGIYDQVGGGFHRYSTDERWLVPHFEKMLYDNALLASNYTDVFQLTHNNQFRKVATDTLNYVLREMTSPEGAFYSATDADSKTPQGTVEEGYYFTWSYDELREILTEDQFFLAELLFGVNATGNFEGRNILYRAKTEEEVARKRNISLETLQTDIEEIKTILLKKRNERKKPLRDEKIITSWNALMISAFAKAANVFGEAGFLEAAENAAAFIFDRLYVDNRLHRSYRDGNVKHEAFLNDYAFLTQACIDLYEATLHFGWLEKALSLDDILKREFEDPGYGGFFMSGSTSESLVARAKPFVDGAQPSGNAIAMLNLVRLGEYTSQPDFIERFEKAAGTFLGNIKEESPAGVASMLAAAEYRNSERSEIVLVDSSFPTENMKQFLNTLRNTYLPNTILLVKDAETEKQHQDRFPIMNDKTAVDGKATAYLCKQQTCQEPTTHPDTFRSFIAELT